MITRATPPVGEREPERSFTKAFGTRNQRIALAVVLLFAVATRVGWMLHIRDSNPAATTSLDTPSYVQPARALAEDGALSRRPGSSDPIYARTPGYPILMGTVFAVDESKTTFLLFQVLLSCLTLLVAYVLAARLWGATAGIVAAALIALDPLQFAASGTLLTESVFSLVLLCAVGIGFRALTPGKVRPRWCALLGVSIAAATLIRPTTYYLPVFVVILVIVCARGSGLRKAATGIAMFLLPIVVVVGGWQVRNHLEVGSWRYSGIEAVNAYRYYAADALARHDGITMQAALHRLNVQLLSTTSLAKCAPSGDCFPVRSARPGPFYDELFSRGFNVVKSHPIETAEGAIRGLGREIFGPGTETMARYLDIRSSKFLKALLGAGLFCSYLAFLYGLILVIRRPDGRGLGHLFALGTAAYVLLVSAGPEAYARFRGPVMPILALYAGLGITKGFGRIAKLPRSSRRRTIG